MAHYRIPHLIHYYLGITIPFGPSLMLAIQVRLPPFVLQVPLVVLQILATIERETSTQLFVAAMVSMVLTPLSGFFDSIIYGWDRKIWEGVLRFLQLRKKSTKKFSGLINRHSNDLPRGVNDNYGMREDSSPTGSFAFYDDDSS